MSEDKDVQDAVSLVEAITTVDPMKVPAALRTKSPLDAALAYRNGRPDAPTGNRYHDSQELLTHPSPTLDPRVITGLPGYDDGTKNYVATSVAALEGLQKAMAMVIEARQAAGTDPELNDGGQALKVAEFAYPTFEAATRKVDAAYTTMQQQIELLRAHLRQPVTTGATSPFAAETRRLLQSMSDEGRIKFLNEAIARQDKVGLSAVLGAPYYLSGITAGVQESFTQRFNEMSDPTASKRLAFFEQVVEHVGRAGQVFNAARENAIGTRFATIQMLREQRERARRPFKPAGAA
jgi:hypothetical protein